jgi:hypothetical protein
LYQFAQLIAMAENRKAISFSNVLCVEYSKFPQQSVTGMQSYMVGAGLAPALVAPALVAPALVAPGELSVKDLML